MQEAIPGNHFLISDVLVLMSRIAGKPFICGNREQLFFHWSAFCHCFFLQIPHETMHQSRNSYVAADAQPLPLHGLGVNALGEPVDYRAYLEDNIQCLLREASERSKGWHHAHGPDNTELAYKKVEIHAYSQKQVWLQGRMQDGWNLTGLND